MENVIDDKLIEFMLSNVKKILQITSAEQDEILKLYISIVCQEIIIKTNRNTFPEDLKYLVITLTEQMYNMYVETTDAESNQTVQSMSEQGRAVTFGTPDSMKIKFQLLAQQQIVNNEKLINRYRLLYKVRCPYAKKD